MADPHHVPHMDSFDRLTVGLYRAGLVLSAVGLLTAGTVALTAPGWQRLAWVVVFLGVALSAADLHLYDKRIRWVITGSGWLGAVLLLLAGALGGGAGHWIAHAGLGFLFVTLSGFALKEQFCFRIPFLRLVPVLLATALIPLLTRQHVVAGLVLIASGLLYAVLAVAKLRMPLHYDVGDKSRYQV